VLFNSLEFPIFLAVALAGYATLARGWRWIWLLVASYVFYGWSDPANLVYLGGVSGAAYGFALAMRRPAWRRAALVGGLVAVLGSLVAFKFYDFAVAELSRVGPSLPQLGLRAPAGYSFYAFMAAGYLIDVWRGTLPAEANPGRLALYVGWFPKVLLGPIERAPGFLPQIGPHMAADPERIVGALQRIGWGLFKKVVIADNLAPIVDHAFGISAYASPLELLIAIYCFAFQIYCDFSGYADMAIGVSRLFGINLMENFRRPYLSRTVGEFWSARWHISLGNWFRDYLYIPLGGSRAGLPRRYLNVMIVFLVSGLWHAGLGYGVGWTFLVWGALNGLYQWGGLAARPFWASVGGKWPRLAASPLVVGLQVLVTFHLILLGWVFFRASSVAQGLQVLQRIWNGLPTLPTVARHFPFTVEHGFALAAIAVLLAVEIADERRPVLRRLAAAPVAARWAVCYAVIFAVILVGRWQGAEFIYMKF
jgi:D-alanyl-lipoteichoic acid acyltransferase DltB (MBOAT superfamily)